jgi:hypothetical protein
MTQTRPNNHGPQLQALTTTIGHLSVPLTLLTHPPNVVGEAVDDVPAAVERARAATARLHCYDGTAVDNITTVASSDLCGTIMGYVDSLKLIPESM